MLPRRIWIVETPVEKKKEALDQAVAVRGPGQWQLRDRQVAEYKEILERNDQLVRIKALLRKEIEAKLKVTSEEIKAEIAKVKEGNKAFYGDAAMRAVKSVSGGRMKNIQEDLIASTKDGRPVDPAWVARIEEEEDIPDNVVCLGR